MHFPKFLLIMIVMALASCSESGNSYAHAEEGNTSEGPLQDHQSDFRPNTTLQYIYTQFLGVPYSSKWFGRLEKTDGDWRDVYVETNEKLTYKGIISFNCNENSSDPVGWISYDPWSEFGDDSEKSTIQIHGEDWQNWQLDNLVDEFGNPQSAVPYEVYVVSHSKFC